MTKRGDIGDGDPCPQNPDHGRMWAYPESQRQFCSHSGHKGENRYEWDGKTPIAKKEDS